MPRFDNLAAAAVTPGGFQAGVNDMVQAILGADVAKQKMAQQGQMRAEDMAFREKSLGAEMANNLAGQKLRGREVAATETRNENWANQQAAENLGAGLDRAGKVGSWFMEGIGFGGKNVKPGGQAGEQPKPLSEDDAFQADLAQVNQEVFSNPKGEAYDEVPENRVTTDLRGRPIITKIGTKRVERNKTPEEQERVRALLKARQDARATNTSQKPASLVDTVVKPNTGDTDGMSYREQPAPAPAPGGLGAEMSGMLGGGAPAIDYAAEDARLQATDPGYKQLRANPRFNWKKAVEAAKASGQ